MATSAERLEAQTIGVDIHRDPVRYGEKFLRIINKGMEIVPFRFNRMQRHAQPRLTGRDIFLKSRQLGVTTWGQAENHRIVTTQTASTITLADTHDHTKNIRTIYNNFYDLWPEDYIGWRMPRDKDSEVEITYPLTSSKSVITTAGSKTAGRSGTYSGIFCSEVAFWKNAGALLGGLLQAATPEATIWLESTPNGAQGEFFDLCMKAYRGDSKWTLHFYPWWWGDEYHAPLERDEVIVPTEEEARVISKALADGFELSPEQIKWRRNTIAEPGMGLLFAQEYPEDVTSCFLKSGQSIFGSFEHCLREPTQAAPIVGNRRVGGIDWGMVDDYTVLSIIDSTTGKELYLGRWRKIPPEERISNIVAELIKYDIEKVHVELNSLGWDNRHMLVGALHDKDMDISVSGFFMTNPLKRQMTNSLRSAIRNNEVELLDYEWSNSELKTFVQTQNSLGTYQYGHIDGMKDDSVIARMAALDAGNNLMG